MKLKLETDSVELGKYMRRLMRDQLPFATQQAVRKTMLDFQAGQRSHQRATLEVRRKTFMDRAIKIRDWPTKQEPSGIVRVETPGGGKWNRLLTDHEEGGVREPPPGHQARAIEQEVRPSEGRIAPKRFRPKNLGFRKVSTGGEKGAEMWQGDRRTFMIRWPDGSGAIFQRTAKGTFGTFKGAKVLWAFTPKGVRLPPSLDFHENAERIVGERWPENMAAAWDRALRTAR